MVIAASDSTNTLVTLDGDNKSDVAIHQHAFVAGDGIFPTHGQQHVPPQYVRTEILVPIDGDRRTRDWMDNEEQEEKYDNIGSRRRLEDFVPLCLPSRGRADVSLNHTPHVVEGCEELLATPPRHFTAASKECILYVAQGERGSATSQQCDVIVSDRATTCHIVAFRSTCGGGGGRHIHSQALTSLTHLDGTIYEGCIRAMIVEHIQHHRGRIVPSNKNEEEKKSEQDFDVDDRKVHRNISIDVHVVGGFDDDDSSSCSITDWFMQLLAQLATEYMSQNVEMVLRTCAVSCMNDNGFGSPIGRGFGVNVHTGDVFLASCDESVMGPASVLRSVRIWSGPKTLSCIHTAQSRNQVYIQPFPFRPFSDIPSLLRMSDEVLLQYTSTSPTVEEPGFCDSVRRALMFLQRQDCRRVFGTNVDQPLVYERTNNTHSNKMNINTSWRLVQ